MAVSNFMQYWSGLLGSLAIIAIIQAAFGIMLGAVKPGDALKQIGAILGIVIALMLMPGILLCAWSAMSFWQQMGLVAIGIVLWNLSRLQRQSRENRAK